MAEGQVLGDPVSVGPGHLRRGTEGPTAFGALGLKQVPLAGAGAHHFACRRDLEALGHRFLGLNAFGSSHKLSRSYQKSANYRDTSGAKSSGILNQF
jgi:hypothetical protein